MEKSVAWALTSFCPNNCSHCGAGRESTKIISALPLEKVKKIIDKLNLDGVTQISSASGEPFLRKDIFEIIRYINKKNISISMVTSGNGLKKEWLDYLLKSEVKNKITFSLDGDTEEINDKIRFKGSFKLIDKHLRQIKDYKWEKYTQLNISISCTLTLLTYKRIKKILDLIQKYEVDELNFNYLLKMGESRNNSNLIVPRNKLKEIGEILDKENSNYDFNITYSLAEKAEKIEVGCYNLKNHSINIDNLGFVFPCDQMLPGDMPLNVVKSLFRKDEALNINDCTLNEIKNGELFAEFRKFANSQKRKLTKFSNCRKCKNQRDCRPCPLIIYNNLKNNIKISPCITNPK